MRKSRLNHSTRRWRYAARSRESAGTALSLLTDDGRPRCVEVSVSPALVGLQVVSLSPLVPRVDEHQPTLRWQVTGCARDYCPEPLLVTLRGRTVKDRGSLAAADAVIERGRDTRVPLVRHAPGRGLVPSHEIVV